MGQGRLGGAADGREPPTQEVSAAPSGRTTLTWPSAPGKGRLGVALPVVCSSTSFDATLPMGATAVKSRIGS